MMMNHLWPNRMINVSWQKRYGERLGRWPWAFTGSLCGYEHPIKINQYWKRAMGGVVGASNQYVSLELTPVGSSLHAAGSWCHHTDYHKTRSGLRAAGPEPTVAQADCVPVESPFCLPGRITRQTYLGPDESTPANTSPLPGLACFSAHDFSTQWKTQFRKSFCS